MNLRHRQMRMLKANLVRTPPMRLAVHYKLRDFGTRAANPSHSRRIDLNCGQRPGNQTEAPAASVAPRSGLRIHFLHRSRTQSNSCPMPSGSGSPQYSNPPHQFLKSNTAIQELLGFIVLRQSKKSRTRANFMKRQFPAKPASPRNPKNAHQRIRHTQHHFDRLIASC